MKDELDFHKRVFLQVFSEEPFVWGQTRVSSFFSAIVLAFFLGGTLSAAFFVPRIADTYRDSLPAGMNLAGSVTPASISIIWPNGGEVWPKKSTQSIEWYANGVGDVRVELVKNDNVVRRIVRRTSGDLGVYDWRMPSGQPMGDTYKVRVTDLKKGVYDESDRVFSIVEADGMSDDPDNGQVSAPTITPGGGTFINSVTVSLSTLTPDAQIYYTLDGSDPTPQSLLYNRPFVLEESSAVAARGFHEALEDSDMVSAEFIIEQKIGGGKEVILYASKDSTLKAAHPNNNTGIIEHLLVKRSASVNRAIVGFDLQNISLSSDRIKRALLVLTVVREKEKNKPEIGNMGKEGRHIGAYRTKELWTEGNARFDRYRELKPEIGSGAGVTWRCPIDSDISNGSPDCDNSWEGGRFNTKSTDSQLHREDMDLVVRWDVTRDVVDALKENAPEVSWIIKKDQENLSGGIFYYSREGAAYWQDQGLGPHLILEEE